MVFSFLNGAELFHKIALLNREFRDELPLLEQEKELSLSMNSRRNSSRPTNVKDFSYGFRLATVVNFDFQTNYYWNSDAIFDPFAVLQTLAAKNKEIEERMHLIRQK